MRRKLNKKTAKAIAALTAVREKEIRPYNAGEVKDWNNPMVGKFYRPVKKPVTVRIDADVLAWLKAQGKGYQTRINGLLRSAMLGQGKRLRA